MKKIPTLFVRDENDRRYVTPAVTPGCEWVLAGEGVPTRKFDGTCVMLDGQRWWARREVKPGKDAPDGFVEVEHDKTTGKRVGWEPIEQSGFAKWFADATARNGLPISPAGTYELCGPRINGNPEGFENHQLVEHGCRDLRAMFRAQGTRLDFESLRDLLTDPMFTYEGVVWHHPDGRMAKLKRRDFPRSY